jgi:hypothetical protein
MDTHNGLAGSNRSVAFFPGSHDFALRSHDFALTGYADGTVKRWPYPEYNKGTVDMAVQILGMVKPHFRNEGRLFSAYERLKKECDHPGIPDKNRSTQEARPVLEAGHRVAGRDN